MESVGSMESILNVLAGFERIALPADPQDPIQEVGSSNHLLPYRYVDGRITGVVYGPFRKVRRVYFNFNLSNQSARVSLVSG